MASILRVKDKDGIVHEIPSIKGDKGDPGPALAVTNTASVGQTIKITAVDENGQPTEWEAVDMGSDGDAWRLITNKTLTEIVTIIDVNSDIDGSPFSLKKIKMVFVPVTVSPEGETLSSVGVRASLNGTVFDGFMISGDNYSVSNGRSLFYEASAEFASFFTSVMLPNDASTVRAYTRTKIGESFTSIKIGTSNSRKQAFGIGTVLEVWGVDA